MTRYAYCNVCKKEIDNPVRKPLETSKKTLWIILIVATVGVAALFYAIYYANRQKTYCPTCFAQLKFSKEPFVSEEEKEEEAIPLTAKEKVLKKAGKEIKSRKKEKEVQLEKEEEKITEEKTFCPYCGEDVKLGAKKCPYCHSILKAPYEK